MAFNNPTGNPPTGTGAVISVGSGAPANSIYIASSTGYVGIGTASPGTKLEVNGNIKWDASNMNPTNLLSNGDFENWSAGTSTAPDGWTLLTGAITRESSVIKLGSYSVLLTRNGTDVELIQDIHTTKGISYWQGRTITFGCWVKTATAGYARLYIVDGIGNASSAIHNGDNTWQFLTVTRTIDSNATKVRLQSDIASGNATAYFDGCTAVEGSSAFAFSDKPAGEGVWADYSSQSTIVGWSSFTLKSIYTKKIGKTVFVNFYINGTSNSVSTSFTLPYTAAGSSIWFGAVLRGSVDNGSSITTGAGCQISGGLSSVDCYKDTYATGWTNSGNKVIQGQFWYEAAN